MKSVVIMHSQKAFKTVALKMQVNTYIKGDKNEFECKKKIGECGLAE